jgi:hypothetical protein
MINRRQFLTRISFTTAATFAMPGAVKSACMGK